VQAAGLSTRATSYRVAHRLALQRHQVKLLANLLHFVKPARCMQGEMPQKGVRALLAMPAHTVLRQP